MQFMNLNFNQRTHVLYIPVSHSAFIRHKNRVWESCRQSQAGVKYLEAVEAVKAVNKEREGLRQQTGNFDWEAEAASLEQAKAQLHHLDKQASSISGELSGLSKVRQIV
jgi:hypothetical protein